MAWRYVIRAGLQSRVRVSLKLAPLETGDCWFESSRLHILPERNLLDDGGTLSQPELFLALPFDECSLKRSIGDNLISHSGFRECYLGVGD